MKDLGPLTEILMAGENEAESFCWTFHPLGREVETEGEGEGEGEGECLSRSCCSWRIWERLLGEEGLTEVAPEAQDSLIGDSCGTNNGDTLFAGIGLEVDRVCVAFWAERIWLNGLGEDGD